MLSNIRLDLRLATAAVTTFFYTSHALIPFLATILRATASFLVIPLLPIIVRNSAYSLRVTFTVFVMPSTRQHLEVPRGGTHKEISKDFVEYQIGMIIVGYKDDNNMAAK